MQLHLLSGSLADKYVCRWGNAKSPAYGTLNDYQFMRRHTSSSKRAEKAKQCWGASLSKVDDVGKVFVKYAKGEHPALTSTTLFMTSAEM